MLKNIVVVSRENGKLVLERQLSGVNKDADPPKNLGTCLLVQQLYTAHTLGFDRVHNMSRRSCSDVQNGPHEGTKINDDNGYYAWARCGGQNLDFHLRDDDSLSVKLSEDFWAGIEDPRKVPETVDRYRQMFSDLPFEAVSPEEFVTEIKKLGGRGNFSLSDLMATAAGRQFWCVCGFSVEQDFDLTTGSSTIRTLGEYARERCCFDLSEDYWG